MEKIPNLGAHLILDFNKIKDPAILDSYELLYPTLRDIIEKCGATIESHQFKKFQPQGLSILYLLSESHFSIHTWPEHGACAIDFYHCGTSTVDRLRKAEELLCELFGWTQCTTSLLIPRGGSKRFYPFQFSGEPSFMKFNYVSRVKIREDDVRVIDSETAPAGRFLLINNQSRYPVHYNEETLKTNSQELVNCGKIGELLVVDRGDMWFPLYLLKTYPSIQKMTVIVQEGAILDVLRKSISQAEEEIKAQEEKKRLCIITQGVADLKKKRFDWVCQPSDLSWNHYQFKIFDEITFEELMKQ